MGRLHWLFMFCVLASPVYGQTVEIRGGEHDNFTRLVVGLPERVGYNISRQDRDVTVAFEDQQLTFDVTSVFNRIPKDRLSDLRASAGSGQFTMVLNCDCKVESFWHLGKSLVLDIQEAPVEADVSSVETDRAVVPEIIPKRVKNPVPEKAPPLTAHSGRAAWPSRLAQDTDLARPPGTAAFLISDAATRRVRRQSRETKPPSPHKDRVDQSRETLLQEFGQAASQGLISPRVSLPSPADPNEEKPKETSNSRAETLSTLDESDRRDNADANMSLNAQTSVSRDLARVIGSSIAQADISGCMEVSATQVSSWADTTPFVDQIGTLRSGLVGEFDQPVGSAVRTLVQFYIHFGFGAEALQTLGQFGLQAKDAPVLVAMANILETGYDVSGSALLGYLDCEPDLAVWSALAYRDLPANVPIDPDAILRGFTALPTHLRAHVGPVLGQRMLRAGFDREAAHINRALSRFDATDTPAAKLLSAQIEPPDLQEQILEEVIASNTVPSAPALVQLIHSRLQAKQGISFELAQLAGSHAVEHRGQPMGEALSRAYLLALAASGAFDQAFAELPVVLHPDTAQRPAILSELYQILAQTASDHEFLYHAATMSPKRQVELGSDVENAIAERLISLGFPVRAEVYVAQPAEDIYDRHRKLLRARIALQRNLPREAELALLGLTGKDVDHLQAKADSMAGAHSSAGAGFAAIGDTENAMQEAWLALDWPKLKDHPDRPIADMADAVRRTAAPINDDGSDAILQRDRARIEDSSKTRAAVEALLQASPSPDDL